MGCAQSTAVPDASKNRLAASGSSEAKGDVHAPKDDVQATEKSSTTEVLKADGNKHADQSSAEDPSEAKEDVPTIENSLTAEAPPLHETKDKKYNEIMNKILETTAQSLDGRRFSFAIGGNNKGGEMVLCNDIGIFGIITFFGCDDAGMQQQVKDMFDGLMKLQFCGDRKYAMIFEEIQYVLKRQPYLEDKRAIPGHIKCTLIACHGAALSIPSFDGTTRVKIIRVQDEGVTVHDVTDDSIDGQGVLGGQLSKTSIRGKTSLRFPRTVTKDVQPTDSFLLIHSGNMAYEDITNNMLKAEVLIGLRSEKPVEAIAASLQQGRKGSIVVVDLRGHR